MCYYVIHACLYFHINAQQTCIQTRIHTYAHQTHNILILTYIYINTYIHSYSGKAPFATEDNNDEAYDPIKVRTYEGRIGPSFRPFYLSYLVNLVNLVFEIKGLVCLSVFFYILVYWWCLIYCGVVH